ncbi:hypothetical protein Tco_0593546 [Tanacetum coccineum]
MVMALRKCIRTGPYTPTMVTTPAVPATEDSPEVPAKTSVETMKLLNVDACQTGSRNVGAIESVTKASSSEGLSFAENLDLIAKYFKKLYQTYHTTTSELLNTRTGMWTYSPRYKNDNLTGKSWNQRGIESEKVLQTSREQSDWLADTDEEIDDQVFGSTLQFTLQRSREFHNADSGTDTEPLEQLDVGGKQKRFKSIKKAMQHGIKSLTVCQSILAETSRNS